MMYSDVMKRTQIYLGKEEVRLLDRAGRETGASQSELIRRAIHMAFGELNVADRIAALRRSAGTWKNRNFTGAEYVDTLRTDLNNRLSRLGFE
jgi:hypothetical protein